jgi:hypothetical protein
MAMSAPRACLDETRVRHLSTYVLTIAMRPNYAALVLAGPHTVAGHRTRWSVAASGAAGRDRSSRPGSAHIAFREAR